MGTKCFRQFFQMPGYDHDMNWNAHFATEIIYFRTANVSLTKAVKHQTRLPSSWYSAWQTICRYGNSAGYTIIPLLKWMTKWTDCRFIRYPDVWKFIRLIAGLADQLTDRTLLQSDPSGWLAERTDSGMNVRMNEQMPGYAHNMNWNAHLRNLKIFFSNLAFHLQTTDKPPGKLNMPTVW